MFFLPCFGNGTSNYGYFFERFSERLGFTTFALDEPHSPLNEKQFLKDYKDFVNHVDEEYQSRGLNLNKYLIGHSLGGL